jgi:AraC-like DNA-binding protein
MEQFLNDRVGRYVVGKSYLLWCDGPTLGGLVLWGRPTHDEAAQLAHVMTTFRAAQHPFDTVTDLSRLDALPADVFEAFFHAAQDALPACLARWRRHAIVTPCQLWGSAVAGAFPVATGDHARRIFGDAASGIAWLAREDAQRAQREVEGIVEGILSVSRALTNLRRFLGTRFADATLEDAARAQGLSVRSLQRELSTHGTTFRRELDEARFRVASDLIDDTDVKLDAIAREVGLSSATKLNHVFRRVARVTPRQLREGARTARRDAAA